MKGNIHKLALFGDPVSHSLSPFIHHKFANQFNMRIEYQLRQINSSGFKQDVMDFFKSGGCGANVTLPHKISAFNLVSESTETASMAKAVNTLFLNNQDQIIGDNTDGIGFITDLQKRCQFECNNRRIVILGAGGAVQGILPNIEAMNPSQLVIVNRSKCKAEQLVKSLNCLACSIEEFEAHSGDFDLIIHGSSLGHQGKTLKFFKQHVHQNTVCYDLSYGEASRAFLEYSKVMGITCCFDGMGMLVEQAAYSFKKWFDKMPKTNEIIEGLL